MNTNIKGIALRTVRHNDRTSILSVFTAEMGRVSVVMPAGNGKESRRLKALTMPMGLFEGNVTVRQNQELLFIRDIKGWGPGGMRPDVSSNALKSAVAMFIAEVIYVTTRDNAPDSFLWNLVVETAFTLSVCSGRELTNLPAAFLFRLAGVVGIAPDFAEYNFNTGLDMKEGVFRVTRPMHDYWLSPLAARCAFTFSKTIHDYSHLSLIHFNRHIRNELIDNTLRFFSLHNFPLDKIKSLDILRTIFA